MAIVFARIKGTSEGHDARYYLQMIGLKMKAEDKSL